MDISLRKMVEVGLPSFLSKKIIRWGEVYKRSKREKRRFSYNNGKPFIKDIDVEGVRFKIVLDPVKNSGVDDDVAQYGFWEKDLSRAFKKHIHPHGVFLDIGANIGYHSLFVASLLKGTGKVYSFEPLPHLCNQLKESVQANGFSNLEICNFALAETEGKHILHIRDENTGGSSLLDLHALETFKVKSTEEIVLKKLDSFLGNQTKVDAIKIDVEGYEYEALKGGEGVLASYHPVIFMEFSPVFYIQDNAQKPHDFIAFLKGLGYSFFTLREEPLDMEEWLAREGAIHSQIDIICRVI